MTKEKYIEKSKLAVNYLLSKIGYQIAKKNILDFDPVIDNDPEFMDLYTKINSFTMTSKVQCYSLYMSVKYVIKADITGDFVECGVWRGGNCMLIAETLKLLNIEDKKIYLYDTFEGMSEPTDIDFSVEDSSDKARTEWVKKQKKDHNEWCYTSMKDVQANMFSTGYPEENFIFIKGKVEETIPNVIPKSISILRLDTDWYESTKHELKHLYPLLSKSGVLMIDDYGTWSGAKKAVDEFFETNPVLLNRIDKGNRLVIKT
ncbi:macrocin O-methyltransferase [Candidatus Kaiserbacteria bacterium RIFOXYD1_FULL_42_15]|uniref:Macrocin O-methyltransferase n=1 Tax=Candidatus Kaiserbacteria bacterium RIFOXYD1_FULL_42_15 TaxID=1798532 RepID=A0A1F6FTU2_9BACT|nr:MAG: macrocin O-methyltransferase [Candidatus Kaiserbacteria bacterium RIFOXYD1_FULL_42_15]